MYSVYVYLKGRKVQGAGIIQLLLLGGGQVCVLVGRERTRSWVYPTTPPGKGVICVYCVLCRVYCVLVGKESTRSLVYPTTPSGKGVICVIDRY